MFAHSAQTASGIRPMRMRPAKRRQPTQNANTDSSVAASTSMATSTVAAVVAPASQAIVAAVVTAAPMPCAKRFGGPGTYFGSLPMSFIAARASGLSVGPVSTRAQKPYVRGTSSQYQPVAKMRRPATATTPATRRAAFSFTGFGKENTKPDPK